MSSVVALGRAKEQTRAGTEKAHGSPIVEAKAVDEIGPTPHKVASKRQIALVLLVPVSRTSILPTCRLGVSSWSIRASKAKQASAGRPARISSNFEMRASTWCLPCATINPYSAKWARNAQASMVRFRTKSLLAL